MKEKSTNKDIFAQNLRKYMRQSGKSRRDICEALGFSYYTFSDWVNGKKYPRMDKVEMLANYFGIMKSDLIEDKSTQEEIEKDSDAFVAIAVKLGADVDFRRVVRRNLEDEDFLEISAVLCDLTQSQLESVKNLLSAFGK